MTAEKFAAGFAVQDLRFGISDKRLLGRPCLFLTVDVPARGIAVAGELTLACNSPKWEYRLRMVADPDAVTFAQLSGPYANRRGMLRSHSQNRLIGRWANSYGDPSHVALELEVKAETAELVLPGQRVHWTLVPDRRVALELGLSEYLDAHLEGDVDVQAHPSDDTDVNEHYQRVEAELLRTIRNPNRGDKPFIIGILIGLYDHWGKTQAAAEWRVKLAELSPNDMRSDREKTTTQPD
jgi:hypothetical protein